MLERMPVIERNSPDHRNGDSMGDVIKEVEVDKVKRREPPLPQPPANQVTFGRFQSM